MKVSWQVTGNRQDAFAKAIGPRGEVDKVGEERGRYMHPTLFGQPKELAIGAIGRAARPADAPAVAPTEAAAVEGDR